MFVSVAKIEEFTRDFLPHINTTFVLISAHFRIIVPEGIELLAPNITSHQHLIQWFATNMGRFTGGYQFHPKVSPFPLGLKPKMGAREFQNPVPFFRKEFLKTINNTQAANKPIPVFAGHISKKTNVGRSDVPSGRKMKYPQYLEMISRSSYVISPDGLNPDCHRHYEALGLEIGRAHV